MTNPDKNAYATYATYAQALAATEKAVTASLTKAPRIVRDYTGYLSGARGKQIRAVSLLACAQAADGSVPADAVAFAAAVELLHLATLIHDDVMDDADLRRGQTTLQKKFGRRMAVIIGDYLLAAALRTAAGIESRDAYLALALPDYVGRICMGELRQQINNYNFSLSVAAYLKIIGGKTAALFEATFYAGAVLAEVDKRILRRYARFGRYVGMIFQLVDDCADFEENRQSAGKPVQSDYEQGVITLPLICALQEDECFLMRAKDGQVTREELNRQVDVCGGTRTTRQVAGRYYDKAQALLEVISPFSEKRDRLQDILERAYHGLKK